MSRLLTHWNSIPGKPGFKTIGGQSIFGSGDIAVSDSSKVPYTGATQGLNMGLYDIQATKLIASNPSGLGPSPYLSAVNSFSEATLELRNSLTNGYTGLNLGSLVASGNITSSGIITSNNAAGGFQIVNSAMGFTKSGSILAINNGNTSWPMRLLTTSSGVRISNGIGNVDLINTDANTLSLYTPTTATSSQTASTPSGSLATLSVGSLVVPNQLVEAYQSPQFKMSGYATGLSLWGNTDVGIISNGVGVASYKFNTGMLVKSNLHLGWSNLEVNGAASTTLSQASSGVLQIGTTSNNALGSLNLANLTMSGLLQSATGVDLTLQSATATIFGKVNAGASTTFRVSAGLFSTVGQLGLSSTNNPSVPDVYLTATSAGNASLGTAGGNALGSLNLANLTASENINLTNSSSRINCFADAVSTGTLEFWRTGDASPIFTISQFGSGTASRRVMARGEGLMAQTDAGSDRASISQYGVRVASGVGFQFSSSTTNTSTRDAGVFRFGVNAIAVGNGTAGDQSGTVRAAGFRAQNGNGIVGTLWINNSNDTWSAFQLPASQNALTFCPGVAGGLFRFEGTTNAHPAFKRSGTTIQARLADDSGDASLSGSAGTFSGVVTSAFRTLSADPTTLDVGSGLSQLVKNTTSGEIRLWVNDGGTMKKSAALT